MKVLGGFFERCRCKSVVICVWLLSFPSAVVIACAK